MLMAVETLNAEIWWISHDIPRVKVNLMTQFCKLFVFLSSCWLKCKGLWSSENSILLDYVHFPSTGSPIWTSYSEQLFSKCTALWSSENSILLDYVQFPSTGSPIWTSYSEQLFSKCRALWSSENSILLDYVQFLSTGSPIWTSYSEQLFSKSCCDQMFIRTFWGLEKISRNVVWILQYYASS